MKGAIPPARELCPSISRKSKYNQRQGISSQHPNHTMVFQNFHFQRALLVFMYDSKLWNNFTNGKENGRFQLQSNMVRQVKFHFMSKWKQIQLIHTLAFVHTAVGPQILSEPEPLSACINI